MAESAALLVDEVLPEQPLRQWVLSFPFPLRFLFASRPEIMGQVLGIVYRVLATHLIKKSGHTHRTAHTGAVTLIQRFGSALNLNIHFHMLFLDGVYGTDWSQQSYIKAPNSAADDTFGATLALDSSGNTLAVGAYGEDSAAGGAPDNNAGAGAAYLY